MTQSFRTIVNVTVAGKLITHSAPVLLLGSCFTENIGARLLRYKFPVIVNPFGVLYNPVSIATSINMLLEERMLQPSDLISHDGLWHSFYHHSEFSDPDPQSALDKMNDSMAKAARFIRTASFVILSLGTARIYVYKETKQVVSNCHKIPESRFERRLLGVEEITGIMGPTLDSLRKINPGCSLIFTLSPIRHWKDGATGNHLSKAILLLAIHQLLKAIPGSVYFPSYEIVMDDLRDYRFYDRDMIHLSQAAIDYIWEKFSASHICPSSRPFMQEMEKIKQAMEHKAFRPRSAEHRKFLEKHLEQIQRLEKNYPGTDLQEEKDFFRDPI